MVGEPNQREKEEGKVEKSYSILGNPTTSSCLLGSGGDTLTERFGGSASLSLEGACAAVNGHKDWSDNSRVELLSTL